MATTFRVEMSDSEYAWQTGYRPSAEDIESMMNEAAPESVKFRVFPMPTNPALEVVKRVSKAVKRTITGNITHYPTIELQLGSNDELHELLAAIREVIHNGGK